MRKGAIVVYESTVYPGVTEDICGPILARLSGLKQAELIECALHLAGEADLLALNCAEASGLGGQVAEGEGEDGGLVDVFVGPRCGYRSGQMGLPNDSA